MEVIAPTLVVWRHISREDENCSSVVRKNGRQSAYSVPDTQELQRFKREMIIRIGLQDLTFYFEGDQEISASISFPRG